MMAADFTAGKNKLATCLLFRRPPQQPEPEEPKPAKPAEPAAKPAVDKQETSDSVSAADKPDDYSAKNNYGDES